MEFSPRGNSLSRFSVSLLLRIVLPLVLAIAGNVVLMGQDNSRSDPDILFARAVQDYNQNRFPEAQSEFEKVEGAHAGEAKQYVAKIKAYTEDMQVANSMMRRSPDERDASSLEYAIQKCEDALKIKPDGPWHAAEVLEKAKALRGQIVTRVSKDVEARDHDFCAKALGSQAEHHYKEAELYSCPLANDNPSYLCGGDEAVHMCQQMRELAKLGGSHPDFQPPLPPSPGDNSTALDRAKAAYERNDFERARTLFARAPADLKSTADEYLDKISRYREFISQAEKLSQSSGYEEARLAYTSAANIKPDGPGNPRTQALLMELEEGIDQFYAGDYVASMHNLEAYARDSRERESLAHFYLGASKLARFFITGGEDTSLQQDAMHDLKIAKQAGYKVEAQDVSPKILKVYNDLAF